MLTPRIRQVNDRRYPLMSASQGKPEVARGRNPANAVLVEAVAGFFNKRQPRRVLHLDARPDLESYLPRQAHGQVVNLAPGDARGSLACTWSQLPFQSRVFDVVLAEHVLCDGDEPDLAEIERVLEGGGRLLIVGRGYWSGRTRLGFNYGGNCVRPLRLCRALEQRDFTIEACRGAGILGTRLVTGEGWKKPLVGISDDVFIQARSQGNARIITPLRFGRTRAVGARTATFEGWNREAAS